jgi:Ran GTPase-activating protein (RanGAP) involved in mRNA processing and transport
MLRKACVQTLHQMGIAGGRQPPCLDMLSLRREDVLQDAEMAAIARIVDSLGTPALDLSKNVFQSDGVDVLVRHLCDSSDGGTPQLRDIKLSQIAWSDGEMAAVDDDTVNSWECNNIAELVHKCPLLRNIDLQKNRLGDTCVYNVMTAAASFGPLSALREVRLANNAIGDEGASAIEHALRSGVRLSWLGLGHNRLTSKGVNGVAEANRHDSVTKRRIGLQELDFGGSRIGDAGGAALGLALRDSRGMEKLSLYECAIAEAGATGLLSALEGHVSLQWLLLGGNRIGHKGAQALARLISYGPDLKVVDVSNNALGEEDIHILLDALKSSPSSNVEQILVSGNTISDGLYRELASVLQERKTRGAQKKAGVTRGHGEL